MWNSGFKFSRKIGIPVTHYKIRANEHTTHAYPYPKPSKTRKIFNKAFDCIFIRIDAFFEGTATINKVECQENSCKYFNLKSAHAEWDLNQDVLDIAIGDIRKTFSWILPCFIKDFAFRLKQTILLYLYIDEVEGDAYTKSIYVKYQHNKDNEYAKIRLILNLEAINDNIAAKCLFFNEWMRNARKKYGILRKLEKQMKTLNLYGYFTPQTIDYPNVDRNHSGWKLNRFKLNPAFSFHKRN